MKLSDLKNYKVVSSPGLAPQGGVQPATAAPVAQAPTQPAAPDTRSIWEKTKDAAYGAGTTVSNFVGAKGMTDQFGADIARARAPKEEKNIIEYPHPKAVVGSALQTGAMLVPGVGAGAKAVTTGAKIASGVGKVAAGAGVGLMIDAGSQLQEDPNRETIKPGVATIAGGALPVVVGGFKIASKLVGRLFKGIGSGVGGVPMDTIESITNNAKVAQQATDRLAKNGNNKVLEENSRIIINGVQSVRKEASNTFRQGLEQLAKEDVKPDVFRGKTQAFLDKYGIMKEKGIRKLSGVEFADPKNVKKASELIDRLNDTELDGKSLRKLADDIDSAMYKTATSDERISYNLFLKDMSKSLKDAIGQSTTKLGEMNAKYSSDMQLVEAVEDIFGSVNFKNLPEVVKASKKLEGIFNQKGLEPQVLEDFLTRIGVNVKNFKTGEAVRQLSNKSMRGSEVGTSLGEMTRAFTSSMITPQDVNNIAIRTGLAKEKVVPFLKFAKQMSPAFRATFLDMLLKLNR